MAIDKQEIKFWMLQWAPTFIVWMIWQTVREIAPKVFLVISAAVLGLILLWPVPLVVMWNSVTQFSSTWSARLTVTVICGVVGTLLYFTRETMRLLYGTAEILVGLAACWAAIGQTSKAGIEGAIALGGGLYIIVRGIENCRKARERKTELAQAPIPPQELASPVFLKYLLSPAAIPPQNPFATFIQRGPKGHK
jgi:hypothetical protein